MQRIVLAALVLIAFAALAQGSSAEAGPISRNNPYRSFNLTGVNYASMQWKRKHGNKASKNWPSGHSNERWFRRR